LVSPQGQFHQDARRCARTLGRRAKWSNGGNLIAQNSRFLVLAAPAKWPNLVSRVLKLACERLA
jgi:hypothetical protein